MHRHYASWWIALVVAGVALGSLAGSPAWAKGKKERKAEKEEEAARASVSADQARLQEIHDRLNGTEWAIELTPVAGEQPKRPANDTIRFDKGRIASERLGADGFGPTNYTITIGGDGVPVWETMQTAQDTSVVFWRGEVRGEAMRGILSKHPAQGEVMDLTFSGKLVSTAPPPPAPSDPLGAAPASAPSPPVKDTSQSKDKKKKE